MVPLRSPEPALRRARRPPCSWPCPGRAVKHRSQIGPFARSAVPVADRRRSTTPIALIVRRAGFGDSGLSRAVLPRDAARRRRENQSCRDRSRSVRPPSRHPPALAGDLLRVLRAVERACCAARLPLVRRRRRGASACRGAFAASAWPCGFTGFGFARRLARAGCSLAQP